MANKRINWKKIRWGTLTRWLKDHRDEIRRYTGRSPFTRSGEINDQVLRTLLAHPEIVRRIAKSHYKRILRKIRFKVKVLKR